MRAIDAIGWLWRQIWSAEDDGYIDTATVI